MKRRKLSVLLICICCILGGCRGAIENGTEYSLKPSDYGWDAPLGETEISYDVPESNPNILVNRLGYEPDEVKTAVFKGEGLTGIFTIRNVENDEIVYQGNLRKKGFDKKKQEFDSYGVFTDLKQNGNFYIQMDGIGESYPFLIHDNLYASFFQKACLKFNAMRNKDNQNDKVGGWSFPEQEKNKEITASLSLYYLLLSYELFPEVYTDKTGMEESGNGIPDILDECAYEAASLIGLMETTPDANGSVCAYRAAALAKFAYLYKSLDSIFAGKCLKAAEESWSSAGKDITLSDELLFPGAAELYRLTGKGQYGSFTANYLGEAVKTQETLTDLEFFGGVTYMNTKNKVKVDLCDAVMKKMMQEAEEISNRSRYQNYLIYSDGQNTDPGNVLQEMMRISIVNHVITNHEYNTVIENHFHYLMGRNSQGICYAIDEREDEENSINIFTNPLWNAEFVFMMSGLLSN